LFGRHSGLREKMDLCFKQYSGHFAHLFMSNEKPMAQILAEKLLFQKKLTDW
jgi:hypothetical protein